MTLNHGLTLDKCKRILLDLYLYYNSQKTIGSRNNAGSIVEHIKALSLYVVILDYYHSNLGVVLEITELDVMELYEKFKQVYYSVKPTYHVG